jgi:arylsulfatase A-like enzyme
MNFQTVSVAQKLVDPTFCDWTTSSTQRPIPCQAGYTPGGYLPGSLAFTPQLKGGIGFVDTALGSMIDELRAKHMLASTKIVIAAKHGQSPIDPTSLRMIGSAENGVLAAAGATQPDQTTDDDVSLMWYQNPANVAPAVAAFQADQSSTNKARIQTLYSGASLHALFGDPATDPRTPDIIIQPIPGTIYSHSVKKVAEHGGFSENDTHVAMLVVDGARVADQDQQAAVVDTPVQNTQVAPTILTFLGLDPGALNSVQTEHVKVLPGLFAGQQNGQ